MPSAKIEPAPRASLSGNPRQALNAWENEGGRTRSASAPLPAGITARSETQYLVGHYRYTDLGLAKAELARQGAAPPIR